MFWERRGRGAGVVRAVLLLCCVLLLSVAGLPARAQAPVPEPPMQDGVPDGVMNLRGWNPAAGAPVDLSGQWLVAWQRLIPGDDAAAAGSVLPGGAWLPVAVPGIWNGQTLPDGGRMAGTGVATYRLRLMLPPDCPALTMKVPQIKSAVRIWLNGKMVAAAGRPALTGPGTDEGEIATTRTLFITLPAGLVVADLVFEVSNHFHFEGGIAAAPTLQAGDALDHAWTLLMLVNTGVAFSLVMLAAYIAAFSWRRASAGQRMLCALLIIVSVRMACTGEMLITAFPDLPAALLYRLEYLPIYLFMSVYYLTLAEMYPGYLHRSVGVLLSILGLSGVLFVLLAPPMQFTRLRDPSSLLLGISIIYFLWRIAAAAWANEFGARLLGVGALVFMGAVVHDTLMYAHVFNGIDLTPFGVIVFMFTHGLILGQRVLRALNQVRQLSGELAVLNEGLERQVQERTKALRQQSALVENVLRTAKEQAESEAELKSRFLAHLSHEVRTPMNAILGMVRLLLRDQPDAGQGERLRLIDQSAKRLIRLLDEVLGLAQLEAGKVTITLEATDVGAMTRDVCGLLTPQAQEKGLHLEVVVAPDAGGWYRLDPLRLQQILFNLITNAIKFTPTGSVVVTVRRGGSPGEAPGLSLEVADSGPGIPPGARDHIFEAFTRIESASPVQGFGLGLTIVYGLVRALHGTISLADRPAGGTAFTVTLPAESMAAPIPSPGGGMAPVFLRPLDILVVEDAVENQVVLLQFLEPAGHHVSVAASGEAALQMLAMRSFDVVLLDIRLQGMDGLETARRIRGRSDERALIPLIAITANVSPQDQAACLAAEIDEVLPKPLDPDLLMAALLRHAPANAVGMGAPAAPPATVKRLNDLFAAVCREQLLALRDALATADHARLTAIAHRLKGSAATYGHLDLARVAAALEGAGPHDDLAAHVAAICAELHLTVARLLGHELDQFSEKT